MNSKIKIISIILSAVLSVLCFASCKSDTGAAENEYRPVYLNILKENEDDIRAYVWQNGFKLNTGEDGGNSIEYLHNEPAQVAIFDICGDKTPELLFISSKIASSIDDLQSELYVYTVNGDGEAQLLYSCPFDKLTADEASVYYPDPFKLVFLEKKNILDILSGDQLVSVDLSSSSAVENAVPDEKIRDILKGSVNLLLTNNRYAGNGYISGSDEFKAVSYDDAVALLSSDGSGS